MTNSAIVEGELVLPCVSLDPNLSLFVDQLGFRVAMIAPADAPTIAVVEGYGLRLRLDATGQSNHPNPATLLLRTDGPPEEQPIVAPNGTIIRFVDANPPLAIPKLIEELVLSRKEAGHSWGTGRAGMQYRDLLPSRLGGRFIASNICIPEGGLVGDYPHFHKIRFQMIFCVAGWARLVYEDQGEPFVLRSGDCVLQPPEIRHQVLESSEGLEVVEIGCPANHETFGDLEIQLPTRVLNPDRDFGGQRFVHHIANESSWIPCSEWQNAQQTTIGFLYQDTGIAAATSGLADVVVLTIDTNSPNASKARLSSNKHGGEFLLIYVLDGQATLTLRTLAKAKSLNQQRLQSGDSLVVPSHQSYEFDQCSAQLKILQVRLPDPALNPIPETTMPSISPE